MSKPSSTNSPGLSSHKNGWYICRASKGVSSKRVIVTRQIRGVVQSNILRCKKQEIKVVIALGIHLFPFRTEKLSPTTSMVLRKSGRVDSCRFSKRELKDRKEFIRKSGLLFPFYTNPFFTSGTSMLLFVMYGCSGCCDYKAPFVL